MPYSYCNQCRRYLADERNMHIDIDSACEKLELDEKEKSKLRTWERAVMKLRDDDVRIGFWDLEKWLREHGFIKKKCSDLPYKIAKKCNLIYYLEDENDILLPEHRQGDDNRWYCEDCIEEIKSQISSESSESSEDSDED